MGRTVETFLIFLRLGLTSFGGPVAHLGYFRDEFVTRRQWFTDKAYADLVALCQLLPGPASSQVGFAIGLARGRFAGASAAFLGFTLPSALVMGGLAAGTLAWGEAVDAGLLKGLKVVAAAVVALALWGMASTLAPDARRASIAVAAAVLLLVFPVQWMQLAIIAAALPIGWVLLKAEPADAEDGGLSVPVGRATGLVCILLFFALLFGLPAVLAAAPDPALALADAFYRSGALVFGGGHVVLPLLQAEFVPAGWVGADAFLAGYGAAQAMPGPLFTFGSYLGVAAGGWRGGLIGTAMIFLPGFLLLIGMLPFWERLRGLPAMRAALMGVNAAVVGILGAAFYDPVWTGAVEDGTDAAAVLAAFLMLRFWKLPPWAAVLLFAGLGWLTRGFETVPGY